MIDWRVMWVRWVGVVFCLVGGLGIAGVAEFAAGFERPSREYSMVPFWSWNGTLDPDEVRRQMDEMVAQGVYGAFMHARAGLDRSGTPYFSDGWWEAVSAAVEHGREVGFKTWIYDEDKWPSGSAGGRVLQRNPERNARKGLRVIQEDVTGPTSHVIQIPGAQWVIAGKLIGKDRLDPETLRDVTALNQGFPTEIDTRPTQGLRVTIVHGPLPFLLGKRCETLGCRVTVHKVGDALDLGECDVLISDVGAAGVGLPTEELRAWIRGGGGYIDFSHSEPTAGLYGLKPVVLADAPEHRWLDTAHPIACLPNANPDAAYAGRRWSDMCWQLGPNSAEFAKVLGDPRVKDGASILAREEGKGRVVLSGATQACREAHAPLELLQNLLVYAGQRTCETQEAADGKSWSCHAGTWRIIGFVPGSFRGINYLNPETVRDFLDITHEEYKRRFGKEFGKTIPGVFFDEIHNSGVPIVWSERFAEEFVRRKGYPVWRALMALRADVGPETPKLRCDYYDVYTGLYEDAWFRQTSEWCAANGLEWTGHTEEGLSAYRNEGDYIRTIRHLQIPGTDNEDFRYRWPRIIDPWKPKQIASVAHVYGKPRAAVEAMGGAGWSFTLDSARYGFNMLSAYGVDFFIPHLFHYAQDRPENVGDWPNSWFFRNPYWKYFRTFATYASRLSYLQSGGQPVVDVAILYPQSDVWAGNGGGATARLLADLVNGRIDADLIDPDSLVRAKIEGEELAVGNGRYRVLVLPGVRCIRRDALAKVAEFATSGRVLVADRWPDASAEAGFGDAVLSQAVEGLKTAGVDVLSPGDVIKTIQETLPLDVVATDGDALRYRHVRKEGLDIYWMVNSQRKEGTWSIRFRAKGAPSLWDPESGSIRPIAAFGPQGEFTSLSLSLNPWQGLFVVFDPTEMRSSQPAPAMPKEDVVALSGPWTFLAMGKALDDVWKDHVSQSELLLPTARIRWERAGDDTSKWHEPSCDDSRWRKIKILDTLHPDAGAARYRSHWRGRFISWYDVKPFHASHGGTGWHCRTRVNLPKGGGGWVAVVADGAFTLKVGDKSFTGNQRRKPVRFEITDLPAGPLTIEFTADARANAVLIEGELAGLLVVSDSTWQTSPNGKQWQAASEYVAPPEKPYGEPAYPLESSMPTTVWYRMVLPPGTVALQIPSVTGKVWVDGRPVDGLEEWVPVSKNARVLAIRVDDPVGLRTPPSVRCEPTEAALGSWTDFGLGWYSGRGLYETTFNVSPGQVEQDLILDLGEVCYCTEIWLNGELVGTRVWPPYRLALGNHVKAGTNRLVVVVANLLANRMRWDIFDDAKADPVKRKWHDANLWRDEWCFRSGLIGPVTLRCRERE